MIYFKSWENNGKNSPIVLPLTCSIWTALDEPQKKLILFYFKKVGTIFGQIGKTIELLLIPIENCINSEDLYTTKFLLAFEL